MSFCKDDACAACATSSKRAHSANTFLWPLRSRVLTTLAVVTPRSSSSPLVLVLTVNDSCLHVASRSCIKGCPRALRKIIITSSLFSELSVRRPTFRFEQIALARSRIRSFLIRSRSRSPLNRLSISRRDIRRTFNVFAYPITASTLVRVYAHHPLFVYLIPIGSIHL